MTPPVFFYQKLPVGRPFLPILASNSVASNAVAPNAVDLKGTDLPSCCVLPLDRLRSMMIGVDKQLDSTAALASTASALNAVASDASSSDALGPNGLVSNAPSPSDRPSDKLPSDVPPIEQSDNFPCVDQPLALTPELSPELHSNEKADGLSTVVRFLDYRPIYIGTSHRMSLLISHRSCASLREWLVDVSYSLDMADGCLPSI